MKFCGLKKTSLADYPDRIAAVLFTPGCNLRCPYCHNWRIVVDPKPPFLQEKAALEILESRKNYVDAVVVTGGEPTLHKELPRVLRSFKERGFAVKLDTNGFHPHVLKECLPHVDYVALDVKTSLEKYPQLGAKDTTALVQTIDMLQQGSVDYEFRATVVPGFVDEEDIPRMGALVKGAKRFVFQQFVSDDTLNRAWRSVKPYSADVIGRFADAMKRYVVETVLRV